MNQKLGISIKKTAQTIPEQLQKNFEKTGKRTFDTKNGEKWGLKKVKFWQKSSIFVVIFQTLELKIHPKVVLLCPKTMRLFFQNNSRTTLKKSRKWLFRNPKWSKWTSQNGQISTKNLNFRGHLSNSGAENTPKSGPLRSKNNALILPKQLQNNFEKVQKMTFLTPKCQK